MTADLTALREALANAEWRARDHDDLATAYNVLTSAIAKYLAAARPSDDLTGLREELKALRNRDLRDDPDFYDGWFAALQAVDRALARLEPGEGDG